MSFLILGLGGNALAALGFVEAADEKPGVACVTAQPVGAAVMALYPGAAVATLQRGLASVAALSAGAAVSVRQTYAAATVSTEVLVCP